MDPHSPPADTLLRHLAAEEALLRAALANLTDVHVALRAGDPAEAQALAAEQPALAAEMHRAAEARAAAAAELAAALGTPGAGGTLAALAERLPPEPAGRLRAARAALRELTDAIAAVQARNANLIGHLRSFLRGALSGSGAPDSPSRYGPSGSRVAAVTG